MTDRISSIQQALREAGLDGWLFYDFRGSDPLAARILKIDPARHMTRRWYYLIPARGTAIKILHKIEPHSLDDVPGETHLYLSWQEQHEHLRQALATIARSPRPPPIWFSVLKPCGLPTSMPRIAKLLRRSDRSSTKSLPALGVTFGMDIP